MMLVTINNGKTYPENVIGFDKCMATEFEDSYKFKHFDYSVYIDIIDTREKYLYDYKTKTYTLIEGDFMPIIKDNYMPKIEVPNTSKFVVIDGVDGCGKGTQMKLVQDVFKDNKNCCFLSFPNYKHDSCVMVEKYLRGDFGSDADSVDPYLAASFYAIDRALTYNSNCEWRNTIYNNGLIIADRYTSANIIHQGSKLPEDKLSDFIKWLYSQEYNINKIPQPDLVIFLNISEKINEELIRNRMKNDPSRADIHEKNFEYISKCRKTVDLLANTNILDSVKKEFPKTNYAFINVSDGNGEMRSRLDIFKDIMYHIATGA